MTFHGSKGLEFDLVFIPHINRGIIPHKKAVSKEEIEEERRMFYVAMTRAKTELVLTCIENEQKPEETRSIFMTELLS